MTDREKAIVMAYTGCTMLAGDKLCIYYEYVQEKLGRSVMTHELAYQEVQDAIKEAAKEDFIAIAKADNGWISVQDRVPDMLEPFWAACKSLTDDRDNWTIEGIYKGTTFGGPWGVPFVEMGKAEVYAWKPKEIPEPPKEEPC